MKDLRNKHFWISLAVIVLVLGTMILVNDFA
jgi:hypothetical protein